MNKASPSVYEFNRARKIVLTGGPGVGKTSIIRLLKKWNYDVTEEAFTALCSKAQELGQWTDQYSHSPDWVHDLLTFQVKQERRSFGKEFLFLDRGKIDIILGSLINEKITPYPEDQIELQNIDYDLHFIIEPLPSQYYDQNLIRIQSFDESLVHHQNCEKNYIQILKKLKKDPDKCFIRVPFYDLDPIASVQRRAQFILDQLKFRVLK